MNKPLNHHRPKKARCLRWFVLGGLALGLTVPMAMALDTSTNEPAKPWKASSRAARKKNPIPADAKSINLGMKVFIRECASCHGDQGLGNGKAGRDLDPLPTDMTDPAVHAQSDGALYWKITRGRSPMPTFKELLTDEERWNVINYIRTLAPTAPAGPAVSTPEFYCPDDFRTSISKVLDVYFTASIAITKGDASAAKLQGSALAGVANEIANSMNPDVLGKEARPVWTNDLKALATAAAGLAQSDSTIDAARDRFTEVSRAVINLTAHFGHAEGAPLQVFISDFVFEGKPATWLQAEGAPRDPFTGRAASKPNAPKKLLGSHQ